ncbi:hypothetical protein M413DRAFT_189765 [Hebeloma cylindrosporum]|uniref:Uncharacterized protein n=1 Tax=Hebeloma cylindrosporum TaxID=76867 RepID=A0A0C2YFY2_HEBCY|nr:hypothetical protein M413DRAFT_189765 [Hebeloma cylindrosporum h7]
MFLQTEHSFLCSNRYIFDGQVVIKDVGFLFPCPGVFQSLSATSGPRYTYYELGHKIRQPIRSAKTPRCLQMLS